MTCEETRSLIQKYAAPDDFTYASMDRRTLRRLEKQLHYRLPQQYVQFLTTYSQGGIFGMVTLGINAFGDPTFLMATEDYRIFGLPLNLIVIEEDDQNAAYCIDLKTEHVVYWQLGETRYETVYPDFCSYLQGRIIAFMQEGPLPVTD